MQIPGARTDGAAVVAVCHQIIDGITAAHCKLDVIKNARGKRKPGEGGDAIPHPLQHLGCKSHFSFLFRGLLLLTPRLHFHADASITALLSVQ